MFRGGSGSACEWEFRSGDSDRDCCCWSWRCFECGQVRSYLEVKSEIRQVRLAWHMTKYSPLPRLPLRDMFDVDFAVIVVATPADQVPKLGLQELFSTRCLSNKRIMEGPE